MYMYMYIQTCTLYKNAHARIHCTYLYMYMYIHCIVHTCTCTCSSSSSYIDLMPQFLRAVRALCNIYPFYKRALQRGEITGVSSFAHSVPASPAITSSSNFRDPFQSSPNVRRAGSFGSLLDDSSCSIPSSHVTAAATNPTPSTRRGFRGHRRTHSQTLPTEGAGRDVVIGGHTSASEPPQPSSSSSSHNARFLSVSGSIAGGGGRGGGAPALEDPFLKLEVVWSSLESWFDLILAEVEKTAGDLSGSEKELLLRRILSVDGDLKEETPGGQPHSTPSHITPSHTIPSHVTPSHVTPSLTAVSRTPHISPPHTTPLTLHPHIHVHVQLYHPSHTCTCTCTCNTHLTHNRRWCY